MKIGQFLSEKSCVKETGNSNEIRMDLDLTAAVKIQSSFGS